MATLKQEQFKVSSSNGSYDVTLSNDIQSLEINLDDCNFYIVDSYFQNSLVVEKIERDKIFFVDADEDSKTLLFAENIIQIMTSLKITRNCTIGVIGGGVIQDIGGFVASIYMRGLDYKLYPTSYLSMVDSCIGGKTSINTKKTKNLLGTFHPPKEVFCYTDFCKTLSDDQINQGLVEALKITYAYKKFYKEAFSHIKVGSKLNLFEISRLSLFSKKAIIEEDEFDLGQRRLLNLGHTFGHSIEKATNHLIEHGYAVGIGILIARSFCLNENLIKKEHNISELCSLVRNITPQRIFDYLNEMDMEIFFQSLENDKKHSRSHYRFILPINEHIEEIEFSKNLFNLNNKFTPIIKNLKSE
jgi:3-dehydroquinate synthase